MNLFRDSWARLLVLCAVVLVSLASAGAFAADRIHLADGRVLEGEVLRELDGHIWFRHNVGGIHVESIFAPQDYTRVERETVEERPVERARPSREAAPEQRRVSGAPRAAVISLGDGQNDMVGLYITASSIRDIVPLLREEEVDIVVFRINSGGGLLLEIRRLTDFIHEQLKPEFRVVSWVESAISAAAMTSHVIEEIYFMPQGNYGAATGWYGRGQAVSGRGLSEVLYMMEQISEKGGYPIQIMRSMQIDEPLSVSFDDRGEAVWRQDESGDHVVNPRGRILTLNALDAERFGFSRGTASNLEQLAQAMGLQEVEWVGEQVRGVPYPVSRAEAAMRSFRDRTARSEVRLAGLANQYGQALNAAQGAGDRQARARMVGIARRALRELTQAVGDSTGHMLFTLNQPTEEDYREWIRQQEEFLRDLMR
ncbi:MAG: hypothetical protein EA378_06025 [Phycisphaerales bacterium]|nr:MAG: hypothetical protein EA378_06025 [Phycisphaerales bacterium]